jgi:hypothetical protein
MSELAVGERDDYLSRLPDRRQQHDPQPQGEEGPPVLLKDAPRRHLRRRGPLLVGLFQIGHPQHDDRGAGHRRQTDVVGARQPPQLLRARAEEGTHEHPDAEHAAQGRQSPGPQVGRHRLGQVRLPGQRVDRAGRPEQQHPEAEHDQRQRAAAEVNQAQDQAGDRDRGRHQHRLALPDASGEDARGDVGHDRADAKQRVDERGDRGAGAPVDRAQRDDRNHRPLREAEQRRRPERGARDRAETELVALPGGLPGTGSAGGGCARCRCAGAAHARPITVFAVPSRI